MSHDLLQQHTIRCNQKNAIEEQLLLFANKQLQLMREAADAANFHSNMDVSYRFLLSTDRMDVNAGGSIACWDRGCWGGSDEICGGFNLDPLVLDGKDDEFTAKQIVFFRQHLKTIAARRIQAAQKDIEDAQAALLQQQDELAKKLAALGEK